MPILIVITYDGIGNSVFQSQVIVPLLARKKKEPRLHIHMVSFEKDPRITLPHIQGITFHIFKRFPFIHRLSLYPNIMQLRFFLQSFPCYEMLARGPFAGFIAYHASNKQCTNITIQARGLVAEEYHFALGSKKMSLVERFRYRQFFQLEKMIYRLNQPHITLQAVSPALKEYMIKEFAANREKITIAQDDIPQSITPEQKKLCRQSIRSELNIPHDAVVYCYSGSYKPWQCPHETIAYFKQIAQQNPHAFLLILTPDVTPFVAQVSTAMLPDASYCIRSVAPAELFPYLAAADFGLLLREKHIINYVSRPTKALEYQAAGLTVMHNDTVAYLKNIAMHEKLD